MNYLEKMAPGSECASTNPNGLYDPYANTLKARLHKAVENAEQSLKDAQRAKEIFEKFPELEELLNLLQRGRI